MTVSGSLFTARFRRPRSLARRSFAAAAFAGAAFAASSSAHAGGVNDPNCRPTALRPYPAVVVHGQAGNFEGMGAILNTLSGAGYCVYARNYGHVPGGANGQDHLSTSAGQIGAFVDEVLQRTGAPRVDVIGHSAGTGVLDNYVLKKGGAAKVHRFVSFGGLHHPYAHFGAGKFLDAGLFLPNVTLTARKIYPGFSVQQVVTAAVNAYAAAGSPLGIIPPELVATAESNFTSDLFDPAYWKDLHGSLSENDGTLVTIGSGKRSLPTNDSAPNVCYTNIVAIADLVTGVEAGFQDEASNVDNYLLLSALTQNAHVDMISDPIALAKMVSGLSAPCSGRGVKTAAPAAPSETQVAKNKEAVEVLTHAIENGEGGDGTNGGAPEASGAGADAGGCSASHQSPTGTGALGIGLGLVAAACVRRRRAR
ncbi:esterase/lipase family protein [Pendulispora albinea]|uniref:Lipase n=1 Tax=Pendulispora albinea TaxID=2741071 RepID=A0ABZ2M033_9BACT